MLPLLSGKLSRGTGMTPLLGAFLAWSALIVGLLGLLVWLMRK